MFGFDRPLTLPIVAKKFRVEMLRDPAYQNGPRIIELDAVTLPTDATLPTVALLSPAAESVFSTTNQVVFDVRASDPDGIYEVEYYIDGGLLQTVTNASDFQVVWTAPQAGDHTITARAYDIFGNSKESDPVHFLVNQAPSEPFQLVNPILTPDSFRFDVSGVKEGMMLTILRSPDLKSWEVISTQSAQGPILPFQDPDVPAAAGARFYKVSVAP
jgi:hypothetical protein